MRMYLDVMLTFIITMPGFRVTEGHTVPTSEQNMFLSQRKGISNQENSDIGNRSKTSGE